MALKLGLNLGYWGIGPQGPDAIKIVRHAESAGYESVWVAESYGSDVVSVLAWFAAQTETIKLGAAIMQVPARPPAAAAMAGCTIDALSGGRFMFGFGPSGPQVSEGWYGVPYRKPWGRTREDLEISPTLQVAIDGDLDTARGIVKAGLLLYFGGMGSRKTNFYVDLAHRFGFGEVADEVQRLYLDGDREAAYEAIPDEVADATSLVGTEEEVAERIERYREVGVSRLIVSPVQLDEGERLHTLDRLAALAGAKATA